MKVQKTPVAHKEPAAFVRVGDESMSAAFSYIFSCLLSPAVFEIT